MTRYLPAQRDVAKGVFTLDWCVSKSMCSGTIAIWNSTRFARRWWRTLWNTSGRAIGPMARGGLIRYLCHIRIMCAWVRTDESRRANYRALFKAHLDPELLTEIRRATNGNFVLGSERFKEEVAQMLKRRVVPGKSGRPLVRGG